MPTQPIACSAVFETATASAPSASAFTMSAGRRSPPVAIRVTSRPTPRSSIRRRARASPAIIGHADVVAQNRWRSAGPATATVEDDVVDAQIEGDVEVGLHVLGGHLDPDRHAAGRLPQVVDRQLGVGRHRPLGEARRRDRGLPLRQPADLGDPADHLAARQVTAGPGLGALTELEVDGLDGRQDLLGVAEPRRGDLVEVARALGPLLGQDAALTRADAGPGPLRPPGQRGLRLLRERSEAHVGDEHRDLEPQRLGRPTADHDVGRDRLVVEQGQPGQLSGEHLQVLPLRQVRARHSHRGDRSVMAGLGESRPRPAGGSRRRTAPRASPGAGRTRAGRRAGPRRRPARARGRTPPAPRSRARSGHRRGGG